MNRLPLDFIGTLMEALLIFFMYMIFYGKRQEIQVRPLRYVLFFFLFATMNNIIGNFMPEGISTLVITITAIGMVYGFLRANLISAVIIVISSLLIVFATEVPVMLLFVFFTGLSIATIVADDGLYLIVFAIVKPLQILLGYFLYRSKLTLQRFRLFQREAPLLANHLIQICLIGIIIFTSVSGTADNEDRVLFTVFSFGVILLLFAFSAVDLYEREKSLQLLAEYRVKDAQIENMKQSMGIIRREKHDFANHIATLQGMVSMNRPNALESVNGYLNKVNTDLHQSFRTFETGNDYLDGLLALKHHMAQEQGIKLSVETSASFNLLRIHPTDLISIMSNLVDNAFDSFSGLSVQDPWVIIETSTQDGTFVISVKDNGKQIPMEISERIFEEGFSTKSKADGERGYGLAITKRYVERAQGTIHLVSTEWGTEFQITLPVAESRESVKTAV